MESKEAQKKIKQLREQINYHDYLYYVEAQPKISDFEYDTLMKELEALEKKFPEFADKNSPTQRVSGQPISGFKVVAHRKPMQSLSNTYSPAELKDWYNRLFNHIKVDAKPSFVCELKIDGLAISLIYENGELQRAVTRGNGEQGDDVTSNVRTIKGIPLTLDQSVPGALQNIEVRGEIYMPTSMLPILNQKRIEQGEPAFANPRNAAAGTLKMLDPRIVAGRGLRFFAYYLESLTDHNIFNEHTEILQTLCNLHFPVNPHYIQTAQMSRLIQYHDEWQDKRHELDYDIDGVVIKVNSLQIQEMAGSTSKSPRWAIAFKFKADEASSELIDVLWQVGRSGAITPVALFNPVTIAKTTVSRATLHNVDEIKRLDIRIGDTITIEKAGDIIPKIKQVLMDSEHFKRPPLEIPTTCPSCGHLLMKIDSGVALFCVNENCPEKTARQIEHFVSRQAMDIRGLGESIIKLLISSGKIKSPADLYVLTVKDLENLPGLGNKSAENLITAINKSKKIRADQFIIALGIPFIGATAAKSLSQNFANFQEFMQASAEQLVKIEGIGFKMAESIVDYFQNTKNKDFLQGLFNAGVHPEFNRTKTNKNLPLEGQVYVITGSFKRWKRDELKDKITQLGGRVATSVSGKTNALLMGDSPGSKRSKAEELGIPIFQEDDIIQLLENKI